MLLRKSANTRRRGLHIGIGISVALANYRLKHPVDHANLEPHMSVQAGAETKLQSQLNCTQVMSKLIRWMKAIAPMCRVAFFTCTVPGLLDCRRRTMTHRKIHSTKFGTAPSRCMKQHSRFGTDSTHWRAGRRRAQRAGACFSRC